MNNLKIRIRFLFVALSILLILFIAGFFYFHYAVVWDVEYDVSDVSVDAVVVITGGIGRIDRALEIFANSNAHFLLISGVGKGFSKKDLYNSFNIYGVDKNRVVLGHSAHNTEGNANEVNTFMLLHGFSSMILVTTRAHMPRTLMLFREKMPSHTIYVSPFAAYSKNSWKSFQASIIEYCKFIATYVVHKIDHWHIVYNRWLQGLYFA